MVGLVGRKYAAVLCVFLTVMPSTLIPGCATAPPGGSETTLSKTQLTPGELLKITSASIQAGQTYDVEFRTAGGFVVPVEAEALADGELYVAVPPVLDPETGVFSSGVMTIFASALNLEESLSILELPAVQGAEAGAILEIVLEAAMGDYQGVVSNLPAVQAEAGGVVDATDTTVEINAQIDALQEMLTELQSSRTLTVTLPQGGTTTLTEAELRTADRLLLAYLAGVADEDVPDLSAKRSGAAHRDMGDCLAIADANQRLACIREVIGGIRVSTGRGSNLASGLATVVGLGVGLYGAVVGAPLVALTGLIVSTIGAATSYTNAAVNNQNSDAFLNGNRPGFDASTEAISQTIRVGTSAASNIPGPIGQVSGAVNVGLSVRDIMGAAEHERCQQQGGNNQQTNDEVILQFCTVTGGDNGTPDTFGGLTGTVVDAQTGEALSGVLLELNNSGGATTTDAAGAFTLASVPTGVFSITASREGYANSSGNVTIADGQTTQTVIALVALTAGDGENVVVVLSWGSTPNDLDLHVSGPDGGSGRFHAYYSNKNPVGFVFLDLDDTSSFGPETMTVSPASDGQFVAGEYHVWVHKYSSTPAFNVSGATVTVFAGGSQLAQYSLSGAPSDEEIDIWEVTHFTVDAGGDVTAVSPVGAFSNASSSDVYKTVEYVK